MSYSLIKKLARQYLFEADAYSKKFGKRLDLTSFVEPFVNKKDENGINIYAVRMTDIPKLGINPKYGFDNPRGVYAYPLTQSIYKQLLDDDLPYVSDAKNILLIKIKNPKKWLNLSLKNFSEYRDWRDVCQLMLDAFKSSNFKSKKVYGRSVSIKNKSLDELFSIAEVDCEHWEDSNAAKIYDFGYLLTRDSEKQAADWQNLLLKVGFEGVYDPGRGILYSGEPFQLVALKSDAFELISTLDTSAFRRSKIPIIRDEAYFDEISFSDLEKIQNGLTEKDLEIMSRSERRFLRQAAAEMTTSRNLLEKMADDKDDDVRILVAGNPHTSLETLLKLSDDENHWVKQRILDKKTIQKEILEKMSDDSDGIIAYLAIEKLKFFSK